MLGGVFAGTTEAPGQIIEQKGKQFKMIRGMGSRSAMEERSGSRVRYHRQEEVHQTEQLTTQQKEKIVPEGVEGLVPFKGSAEMIIRELVGGIQAGLAHSGSGDIQTFQKKATLWHQSFAGIVEGKPHDII